MTLSNDRRLELLERLGTPRVGEVEAAGDIEVARGVSFALHRAAEPDATAEQILAAQRIAERLIGDGGHFRGEMASLLRAVLERELAPV